MKRLLILMLCACVLAAVLPVNFMVFAEDEPETNEPEPETLVSEESEPDEPAPEATEPETEEPEPETLASEANEPDEPEPEEAEAESEADVYDNVDYSYEVSNELSHEYVLDEIIIKFKEPWQVPGKEKQLRQEIEKVKKVGFVEGLGAYVVKIEDLQKNPNAILNRLKNNKYIEYVEPNYIAKCDASPDVNNPDYKLQNSIVNDIINAPAGWNTMEGYQGIPVAVIDTGIAVHPDMLLSNGGYSALANYTPNNDAYGHGTKVAGIIGALGDNKIGTFDVKWKTPVVPVKIEDGTGSMSAANIAKGIIWAADNGIKIINMSLGMTANSATVKNAVDYAYNKGCAMFAAAGNSGLSTLEYPARYANVMAVSSTNDGISRFTGSNYGSGTDVVASRMYYTTMANGGYIFAGGTSIATPQVAGLASLVWAVNPTLTNDQVYDLIRKGAKPLGGGYNEQTGYGLIDIGKTLQLAQASPGAAAKAPEPKYNAPPTITLQGFAEITIEVDEPYVEMGYAAVDCLGADITKDVTVAGTVNTAAAGVNTITYEVTDAGGNAARVTRIVFVTEKAPPEPKPPHIAIIGSNPIILHLTSDTLYEEQGAVAIDEVDGDISSLVTWTEPVVRDKAGTYTVEYKVTNSRGLASTVTRDVVILAPKETRLVRDQYNFSGQGKQGATFTHKGIVAEAENGGFMDLKVTKIDNKMTISVKLIDAMSKKVAFTDKFSAAGSKQYKIDSGEYYLEVTIDAANGNSSYALTLVMPEVVIAGYEVKEVPKPNVIFEDEDEEEEDIVIQLFEDDVSRDNPETGGLTVVFIIQLGLIAAAVSAYTRFRKKYAIH